MPDQFIAHIESTDLIHGLFTFVLNETTKQWQLWSDQVLLVPNALNVTARDLMNYDLVDEIRRALIKQHMPAR